MNTEYGEMEMCQSGYNFKNKNIKKIGLTGFCTMLLCPVMGKVDGERVPLGVSVACQLRLHLSPVNSHS
jgi:hypothetical protein